ncbi:inner membrane component of tripartite multidrug resistance system [Aquitalea magnusonii]|uniref:Inner membrane component of tripartite multidrug resistance system n=1 Tax=Aquitalea magnusonii TaxID=332411 RepID=A0A3G9GDD2_9NEIS|nr:FUSC family protein [Aquitalea magnusonii]BBF85858.1 inner membrane component of tripartite multidrug resistance system [Aquitalea magnusonii]
MTLPSWRDWFFSAKVFAAAMLALFIAMALELPRPYWAMATVYVVSHPLTGATRSKAVYRIGGTLLGASAAVVLTPLFVNAPTLLCLVVALWTGSLLSISLLDRTPRSYLFMLSAYTLPMIALPTLNHPETIFDVALARSEEILLGILCASVVSALIWPGKVAPIFSARISSWMQDTRDWACELLSPQQGGGAQASHASRHKLAADILALDQFISHLSYDTTSFAMVKHARELRGRMSMLLPILSSLTETRQALVQQAAGLPASLTALMQQVADWMNDPDLHRSRQAVPALQRQLAALKQQIADGDDWQSLLIAHVLARVQSLINLWLDCRLLQQLLAEEHPTFTWKPAYRHWPVGGTARHYDYGMVAFSSLQASTAIFLASQLWIGLGWTDGSGAVIMVAIASCFFAALDEPAPMMRTFLIWALVSIVLTTVLLFMVIPAAYTFEMLVAMLAIPFLLVGTLFTRPQFTMIAMMLTVNTATFLSLQGAYDTDFTAFFNGNVATVVGVSFALLFSLLVRPFGIELAIRRLRRASWHDLARMAAGRGLDDYPQLTARMLDRLGQLIPRLAASGHDQLPQAFSELRTGFSVLHLQRDENALSGPAGLRVQQVLDEVAAHYRQALALRQQAPTRAQLLQRIDAALDQVLAVSRRSDHHVLTVLNALVELRVTLFPAAGSYAVAAPLPLATGGVTP